MPFSYNLTGAAESGGIPSAPSTGGDWSTVLAGLIPQGGGGPAAGGSGGMTPEQMAGGVAGTVWSAVGNAFAPGSGQFLGQVGTYLGSQFGSLFSGGGTPSGTTEFDGWHDARFPALNASDFKQGELRILKGYAEGLQIGVEAVREIALQDARDHNHSNLATIFDAWRNNYTPDLPNARLYIASYNRSHSSQIKEGDLPKYQAARNTGVAPSAGGGVLNFGNGQLPANTAGYTSADFKRYYEAILNGAKNGAVDVFTQSPQGRELQNAGAKDFAARNAPYLVVLGAGFLALPWVVKYFTSKR